MAVISEKVWWLKDGKLGIATYNYSTGKMTTLSDTGDTIRIHFVKKASALTVTLSGSPDIPSQFHDALIARVMEKLYARKGMMVETRYWRAEWQDYLKSGIVHANKAKDGTSYSVAQHSY